MTLRKRYLRNIKGNRSFALCTVALTALVVVLFVGFNDNGRKYRDELNKFYDDTNVEDAQFTTATEISEDEIADLEDMYDVDLELQRYIDIEQDGHTIRIMEDTRKINRYCLCSGEDVTSDNEILLNSGYLSFNDIKIGDEIDLEGNVYTITGTFQRPDYLFMIKETSDTYAMREEFGIARVTEDRFEELSEDIGITGSYYSIVYNKDNADEVRKAVNEDYVLTSYLAATSNSRINTPQDEVEETVNMMSLTIVMFVIFIAVIVSVVIGRKIRSDRRQIGVLLALGYRKTALALHYTFYGIVPGLVGSILGIILSFIYSDDLAQLFFEKIEPVPATFGIRPAAAVISLTVPAVLYTIAVLIEALKIMRTDVITMISGRGHANGRNRLRLKKSKLSLVTKYRLRQIAGKPGRSVIVVIGMAFAGVLCSFCMVCIDSMDSYCKNTIDKIGSFEYEYFLSDIRTGTPEEGVAILGKQFEVKDRRDLLMLMGIDDPKYINLEDPDGNKIEFDEDHCYLTSMASLAFNVEKGDTISFIDPITLDEYSLEITDIVENDSQSAIYCSRERAAEVLDIPEDVFNIVMSDKELDISEDEVVKTISKGSLADQINEVKSGMEDLIGIINAFAIVIGVIVVYMMVNLMISESSSTISMLKVLGYRNGEINKMITNVYHVLVPISIVLSIVLGVMFTKATFDANVAVYRTYIMTLIYPGSVVKIALLIILSYAISLFLLKGKASRVDLIESLKDNRE